VIGFSGSGKTTLARHLAKQYDAEWVELDVIMYDSKTHKLTDRYLTNQKQRLLAKYIRETNTDLSHMAKIDRSNPSREDIALMIETGRAFVEWLTTKNTERCVISGLDLIDIIPTNPNWYGAPIVFKGTSRVHSMYRRMMRNKSSLGQSLAMIPQLFAWYKADAHGIDYIRSMTIDKYNYQERDELGEFNKSNSGSFNSHHSLR
jgi:ABC-type dipeptide/oligopeptide/nickel transport system ATPase component